MRNLLKSDVGVCTSQSQKGVHERKGRALKGGKKQREGNAINVIGKQSEGNWEEEGNKLRERGH